MLLLLACMPTAPPPDRVEVDVELAPIAQDRDGDGAPDSEDCRPDDPAVFPGADERCDGADQDCDGAVDEAPIDGTERWPDDDGDGFGAGAWEWVCAGTIGFADNRLDCDDFDAELAPNAVERCDELDNDCDGLIDDDDASLKGASPFYADDDGDGFGAGPARGGCSAQAGEVANAQDCAPEDAATHPGALERCDEIDDDCDGLVDDADPDVAGRLLGFVDGDGDGWGAGAGLALCVLTEGLVANPGDCDDADARVSPLGVEVCGGQDDDCDGLVDDVDPSAVGRPVGFADLDGDGWGDATVPIEACTLPDDAALIAGDCDDEDAAFNPGAEERCTLGDEDCDGLFELGDPSLADAQTVYDDSDGDGFVGGAGYSACEGETVPLDCDDADTAAHPGAAESCSSEDRDCDGLSGMADPDVVPTLIWYTDADADGYGGEGALACAGDTLVPGDCDDTDAAVLPTTEEVCNNGIDDDCDAETRCGMGGWLSTGEADGVVDRLGGQRFGAAVGVWDIDGDGLDDLIVSEPGADDSAEDAGAVWIVPGPVASTDVRVWASATIGGTESAKIGGILAPAGADTLAVGVGPDLYLFTNPTGALDLGAAAAVLSGCESLVVLSAHLACAAPDSAEIYTYDEAHLLVGTLTGEGDGAGADLAAADLDGDGLAELLVGAPGNDAGGERAGAVYSMASGDSEGALADVGAALLGIEGDNAGWITRGIGDLDGDGLADLAIGAPGADAVLVVGAIAPGAVRDVAFATFIGGGSDGLGRGGATAADFNADGQLDLALGAPGEPEGPGATWVWFGPLGGSSDIAADVVIAAENPGDGLGARFGLAAGDLDGDEVSDLVLASPTEESGGETDQGAVFLFAGGGL